MRRLRAIAAITIALGMWTLLRPLAAETATYGHCREVQQEFTGHEFRDYPTDTVCRTCAGPDGAGCHLFTYVAFWNCGPEGVLAGHYGCPNQ